jgi:DNA topoisomerase IA
MLTTFCLVLFKEDRSVVQERGYMAKEGRALRATSRGRVLSAFLQQCFAQYVDYEFTSDMESQLADVPGDLVRLQCINESSCWIDSA